MRFLTSSLLFTVALVLGLTVLTPKKAFAQHPLDLSERVGLTLMVNVGPGYQHDSQFGSDGTGLGRVSLGVGDFLKNDLAVFLRFSVTNVDHEDGFFPQRQTSGFGGVSLQFWQNSRFFIETGLGVGFTSEEASERRHGGISALIGTGVTLFSFGKSNVHFGMEYSPAVVRSDMVHTIGINVGYQLF